MLSFSSRSAFAVALVACLAGAARAAETPVRSYAIPGHGTLELKIPADWKDAVAQPPKGLPPTLEFTPPSGKAFKLLVTALWSPKNDSKFNTPAAMAKVVNATGQDQLPSARETTLDVSEITVEKRGPVGYLYTLTDKAPAPGSYEYMTQGIFATGDLELSFTLLSHEKKPAAMRATLKALATAKQTKKG